VDLGFVDTSPPRDRIFKRELDAELQHFREFLSRAARASSDLRTS